MRRESFRHGRWADGRLVEGQQGTDEGRSHSSVSECADPLRVLGKAPALTNEGVNGKGQTVSNTTEFLADGKEHPVPNTPEGMAVIVCRIRSRHVEMLGRRNGREPRQLRGCQGRADHWCQRHRTERERIAFHDLHTVRQGVSQREAWPNSVRVKSASARISAASRLARRRYGSRVSSSPASVARSMTGRSRRLRSAPW